jgi:5,5'-dehydrodivanillate O-demethylase
MDDGESGELTIMDLCLTGPGTIGGRYLRRFWHPVIRSDDLPARSARPIKIMSEEFTVYRGESGQAYIVGKRCPHRGTQLSVGWIEDEAIRCRYHGWKFGGTGQCLEMPAGNPDVAAKIRIPSYPTLERLGLIYGYFGEGEPPPFHFPDFERPGEGFVETRVDVYACNYLQSYENDWDLYHAAWTHRTGAIHTPADPDKITFEETDFGVVMRNVRDNGMRSATVLMPPTTVRLPVPSFNALSYRGAGPAWRDTYIHHTPIDDESHLFFMTQDVRVADSDRAAYRVHYDAYKAEERAMRVEPIGEDLIAGRYGLRDVLNHPNLVMVEDYMAQIGQGRIQDRGDEHLSRTDKGVVLLRRILLREMKALRDGRPPKAWAVMGERPDKDIVEGVLGRAGTGALKPLETA